MNKVKENKKYLAINIIAAIFLGFLATVRTFAENRFLKSQFCEINETSLLDTPNFPVTFSYTDENDKDVDSIADLYEESLINKFAPQIILDEDEEWFPANVKWVEGKADLKLFNNGIVSDFGRIDDFNNLYTKVPTQNYLTKECAKSSTEELKQLDIRTMENQDDNHYFYLDLDNEFREGSKDQSDWIVYSRVYKNIIEEGYNIQYWYYFPHNQLSLLPFTISGKHEGDWEHITVVIDSLETPQRVCYSSHSNNNPGYCYEWNDGIDIIDQNHPVVRIAKGSHASYRNLNDEDLAGENTFTDGIKWNSWESEIINLDEVSTEGSLVNDFVFLALRWGDARPWKIGGSFVPGHSFAPYTLSFQESFRWNEK